jgi:hypothetical protein
MNIDWTAKVKKKTPYKTTRFEIPEELRKRSSILSNQEDNTISLLSNYNVRGKLALEFENFIKERI